MNEKGRREPILRAETSHKTRQENDKDFGCDMLWK